MGLFTFTPRLPVSEEERQWVDEGFVRLEKLLGRRRMMEAVVVLPDPEYFPDVYDATPVAAEKLFRRVCGFMQVDYGCIDLQFFPDRLEELRKALPYWSGNDGGCAGFYIKPKVDAGEQRMLIALRSTQLKDPLSLVATVAHELGHAILLGRELLDPSTPDHEPLTDLLTVFLGLGIFTANSSAQFKQYQDERRSGWSMRRLGYLPQEVYGYALAKFVTERGEEKPAWTRHLSTNVQAYFKRSRAWLAKNYGRGVQAPPIR